MKNEYSIKEKKNLKKNKKIQMFCITSVTVLLISYAGCNYVLKKNKTIKNESTENKTYNYFSKNNDWFTKDIILVENRYEIKNTKEKIRILK